MVVNLRQLQDENYTWAKENTPDATAATIWRHIAEEWNTELSPSMQILTNALLVFPNASPGHRVIEAATAEVAEEMADIVILFAHLANKLGVNLQTAVEDKWQVVQSRIYVKGDDGVYRHQK